MATKDSVQSVSIHPGIVALLWFALFLLPQIAGAKPSGEQLLEDRCSLCHDKPEPGKLTREEWVKQLKDMAPNAGLSKAETETVLQFVTSHAKDASTKVSMATERRLFEEKCSKCHTTRRIFLEPLSSKTRRHIVFSMRERAQAWISPQEAEQILDFLNKGAPGANKPPKRKPVPGGPEQVFKERCTACHTTERIYAKLQENNKGATAGDVTHVVNRMRKKAPEWITGEEAKQILQYLETLNPASPN